MEARTSHHSSPETSEPCITSTWRRKRHPQRRAGMQEDPAVVIALVHANSNPMGSYITSDCCVQRSCSAKLYALRTGRHGGQREQRLTRPSRDPRPKTANLEARKRPILFWLPLAGTKYEPMTKSCSLMILLLSFPSETY